MAFPVHAQQPANDPPTQTVQSSESSSVDRADGEVGEQEIIVEGLRLDLDRAIQRRRDETAVADFLPVGDIGELVTTDIADALEFIPGAVGTRFRGTVETVALRGLPAQLTLATVDGRVLTSKQGSRSVFFRLFPSEFFNSAAVYKSGSAELTEGGIAGSIVLETPSPLSQTPGVRMSGRVKYAPFNDNYRLGSRETGARINAFGSQRFDLGGSELGVALGFNYLDDPITTAQAFMNPFVNATIRGTNAVVPSILLFETEGEVYQRTAGLGVIEWESQSGFSARVDAIYTDARNFDRRNFLAFTGLNVPARYTSAEFEGGALQTATVTGVGVQNRIERIDVKDKAYMVGGKLGYEDEDWDVALDIYRSQTDSRNILDRPILAATGIAATITYLPDDILVENINRDLTNPAIYGVNQYVAQDLKVRDRAEAIRLDVTRKFDGSWLGAISAGVNYSTRKLVSLRIQDINNDVRNPALFPQFAVGRLPASFFTNDQYLNFSIPSVGGLFPAPFALINHDALIAAMPKPRFAVTDTTLLEGSVDNLEKTWAGYVKADFGTDRPLSGNIGVRVVHTDLTARGYTGDLVTVTDPVTGAVTVTVNGLTPATERNGYTEVLPSLNLKYEITPKLQARFAAGRAIARAEFFDLRLAESLNGGDTMFPPFTGTAGNPQLEPIRSNQVDAALEWYPGRNSTVTLSAYYKHVKGFVQTRVRDVEIGGYEFQLSSPVNTDAGDFYGVELTTRFDFDFLPSPLDGLGFIANATYNETTIDPGYGVLNDVNANGDFLYDVVDRNPGVEGYTKWTASGILYYEKGPVGLRFAGRYASDRVRQIGSLNAPIVSNGRVLLDASTTLRLTDNVRLQFQAVNLTKQVDDAYYVFDNYTGVRQQTGRSFFFGADFNF